MSPHLFWPIVRFELTYHFSRISTYVYFAIWFVLAGLLISMPTGQENAVLNSPAMISSFSAEVMAFGVIVVSAICGMAVCRDFEEDTYQLLFTTPLRRRDYLLGRLAGSLLVSLVVFLGIPLGLLLGTVAPWADHEHMAPIRLWVYVQPYLVFIAVAVCWTGALFFAVGALTRRIVFVYLQGVLLVAIYMGVDRLLGNLNDFWPALVDPFGFRATSQVTKYWTLAETNTRLVPLAGAMLWNRLIWLGVGVAAVVAVLRWFPFSADAFAGRRTKRRRVADEAPEAPAARAPLVRLQFNWRTAAAMFAALTRLRVASIVTDLSFIAIAIFTVALDVVIGWGAPRMGDTPLYPVTYLMTSTFGPLMAIVITTMYAGELVWKERALKYDQVYDALPMPGWLNFTSQLAALTVVQVVILAAIVAAGIAQQAAQGYYRFELDVYFMDLFVFQLSMLILYSVLALFVQTLVPNKFLGHAIVIGVFLAPGLLVQLMDKWNVTIPANLYGYARTPGYTYSAMNRWGPFVRPIAWYTLYWGALAGLLAAGALLFARRGTDRGWSVRWRQGRARMRAPLVLATFGCLAAFIAIGGYLYYDARVVNTDFTPRRANEAKWARYEKEFKQYETLPQPKITAVDVAVDIVPERAAITATGTYTVVNQSSQPIPAVHVLDAGRTLRQLSFDRPFKEARFDQELRYHIYQFAEPLAPGETVHLHFTAGHENHGFQDTGTNVVANGTFWGLGSLPTIGYQRGVELTSEDVRKKHGLPRREDVPPPDGPGVRSRNLFTRDADWITFKATVSTEPDQVAIAPGYLTREWVDHGRRYFAYDMGDTKILNFYTFVSARYVVKREAWHGVNIEVYYDPQHPYNVDRMIQSARTGLDYFAANFGPYQFRQFRILEFPRYAGFAQSFPNTVPYSESIGFIFHPEKDDDLDYPLYVTAHELAHQWWGHQVVGAWAQGSNILSETLAEYSALMVLEHTLGPSGVRTYLKHDLDAYLRGRRGEVRGEQTLARVTRQGYVWYNKGSLVMYALKDYIGEDRLNAALRAYLEKNRFQDPPYTTVDDFIEALRAVTPDDRKYLIHDFFETITLFDNRAVSAAWRETPDHRYAVTLKVSAAKLRADDKGNETAIPIDDLIDIGVFSGTGKNEKTLFLEKRRITQHEMTFEVVVDERPSRAGIDPYNKLIDRVSDDNVVAVKKGG
jgi:ABC-type transport system involved in multi-copper enzyme maturation permease subunit